MRPVKNDDPQRHARKPPLEKKLAHRAGELVLEPLFRLALPSVEERRAEHGHHCTLCKCYPLSLRLNERRTRRKEYLCIPAGRGQTVCCALVRTANAPLRKLTLF